MGYSNMGCRLYGMPRTTNDPEHARFVQLLRRYRERVENTQSDRIDTQEVFASDGWRCGLCGEPIS